jgi:anti-anti-sigma factor
VRLRLDKALVAGDAPAVPVLRLDGEFDIDTVPEIDVFLRRRLGPLYQRRTLVIDLGDVTFVDSSFIGFVVRFVGEERRGRGELVLAHPVGAVRTLLCMVGLPNLVPMYESLEDALHAVRGATSPLIPPAFSLSG